MEVYEDLKNWWLGYFCDKFRRQISVMKVVYRKINESFITEEATAADYVIILSYWASAYRSSLQESTPCTLLGTFR